MTSAQTRTVPQHAENVFVPLAGQYTASLASSGGWELPQSQLFLAAVARLRRNGQCPEGVWDVVSAMVGHTVEECMQHLSQLKHCYEVYKIIRSQFPAHWSDIQGAASVPEAAWTAFLRSLQQQQQNGAMFFRQSGWVLLPWLDAFYTPESSVSWYQLTTTDENGQNRRLWYPRIRPQNSQAPVTPPATSHSPTRNPAGRSTYTPSESPLTPLSEAFADDESTQAAVDHDESDDSDDDDDGSSFVKREGSDGSARSVEESQMDYEEPFDSPSSTPSIAVPLPVARPSASQLATARQSSVPAGEQRQSSRKPSSTKGNMPRWTKEEEDLLISEIKANGKDYANIEKRHGSNGTVSTGLSKRSIAQMQGKVQRIRTEWRKNNPNTTFPVWMAPKTDRLGNDSKQPVAAKKKSSKKASTSASHPMSHPVASTSSVPKPASKKPFTSYTSYTADFDYDGVRQ